MNYYDEIAEGYEELHKLEQLKKLVLVKKLLAQNKIKIEKSTTLLDVGCGTGLSSIFDCDVTGIDPSEELLKQCVKNNPLMKTVVGKAESLPFKDESFDISVSITAAQNFGDIEKAILEIVRVTRRFVVISFLKKSDKRERIEKAIKSSLKVIDSAEEDKDVIFICSV